MKLSEIARICAGVLHGTDLEISQVSTDTRTLVPGDLYVAVRGEHYDGADFIGEALARGAVAVVAERPVSQAPSLVEVPDARIALGHIAAAHVQRFDMQRVAVTGNSGKTTVKDMIACLLGTGTLATSGNLNNEIGVPLTLLRANEHCRFGVFELGASKAGDIAWTTSLVRPHIALITNVTGAHLAGFGSMQGIADAKAEIYQGVVAEGVAVINLDDAFSTFFSEVAKELGLRVVTVSARNPADLYARDIQTSPMHSTFQLCTHDQNLTVDLPLPGSHQVINALMALAVPLVLGMDMASVVPRLRAMQPVPGRMHAMSCFSGTLIDDSYNANPGSVRAAIDALLRMPEPRVLVFGGMAELGDISADSHAEIGAYARQTGIEELFAVGDAAIPAAREFGPGASIFLDVDAAVEPVVDRLKAGATLLVKGSRAFHMDSLVRQVCERKEGRSCCSG